MYDGRTDNSLMESISPATDDFVPDLIDGHYRVTDAALEQHNDAAARFLKSRDAAGMPTILFVSHSDGFRSVMMTQDSFRATFGPEMLEKVKNGAVRNGGHYVVMTVVDAPEPTKGVNQDE